MMTGNILRKAAASFLVAAALAPLTTRHVQAQQTFWAVSYGVTTPLSTTKDFTDGVSLRNIGLDLLLVTSPKTTVGLSTQWNVFYERTSEVSSVKGAEVQGTQDRYINTLPIRLNARFYGGRAGGTRPYLGVGVGPQFVEQRVEVGQFILSDESWHLGVAPEVGIVVPLQNGVKTFLNARYNYAATAGEFDTKHSYFGVNIGFAWTSDSGW
jgi:outer membrane protein W